MSIIEDPAIAITEDMQRAMDAAEAAAARADAGDGSVFEDYDIVVSIPRRVINEQLKKLHDTGAIPPRLVIVQHVDAQGNFTFESLASPDQIPRGPDGKPTVACIDAEVCARIDIPASGTLVTLVLQFISGAVWTGGGFGPLAGVQEHEATGWSYGLSITLDLAAVAKDDLAKNAAVPAAVKAQLGGFMDAMFQVDHLFLDLDSADLLKFDPTTTHAGDAGDEGERQLATFMQFYLRQLSKGGSPFILGYAVSTSDQTQVPQNQQVPDSLRPTGTTFTLYQDPADPDLSTVNYVLVTRGGHQTIPGTPANFTSNWIAPGEQCDAKVIYSHYQLTEPLLVKPVFSQVREGVYQQISQNINVPEGNDYGPARQVTAGGWSFDISAIAEGDDQYQNSFAVSCIGPKLSFGGRVQGYKEVSQNDFFCTARASAWGDTSWAGGIVLWVANGALKADGRFATTSNRSDSDSNSCANAFSWIGRVLGGVLDVFTGWADGGYFSNLFASAFSVSVPGIGGLNVVLDNLSASATSVVMLPAGEVFELAAPSTDAQGNVALELTYRR